MLLPKTQYHGRIVPCKQWHPHTAPMFGDAFPGKKFLKGTFSGQYLLSGFSHLLWHTKIMLVFLYPHIGYKIGISLANFSTTFYNMLEDIMDDLCQALVVFCQLCYVYVMLVQMCLICIYDCV